jgi:hypothetical protein
MVRKFPAVPFERYVDDSVVHCVSEHQARTVRLVDGRILISDDWPRLPAA